MMPSVMTIITKLKLVDSNVLNIYLFGSRFWGDFEPSSDYDFIIILSSYGKVKEGVHCENIDATLYSLDHFQEELRMCKFLPVMTQIFKDRSVVIERVQLDFVFSGICFKQSVMSEITRDIKMIEKTKAKDQHYKYRKIIKYSLRMGLVSFEILTQGISSIISREEYDNFMTEETEVDVHRIYEKIDAES